MATRPGVRPETLAKFEEALREPTLERARTSYGGSKAFWAFARYYGRTDEVKAQYAEDINAARRANQLKAMAAREDATAYIGRPGELIEDADFIARNGEIPANAAKRLGYPSVAALSRALDRADDDHGGHRGGRAFTRMNANDALFWKSAGE